MLKQYSREILSVVSHFLMGIIAEGTEKNGSENEKDIATEQRTRGCPHL